MGIYLIIEGEKDKSQELLWRYVNLYLYNGMLNIITCDGITKVLPKFNDFYNSLSVIDRNNSLFIFDVDRVINTRSIQHIINIIQDYEIQHKNIKLLNIYCFEDTLLSFRNLMFWIYNEYKRVNIGFIQQKVQLWMEYIGYGEDYTKSELLNSFVVQSKIAKERKKGVTRENLAHYILSYITANTNFLATKDKLGICYYCNCMGEGCVYAKKDKQRVPLTSRNGLCVECFVHSCYYSSKQKIESIYNLSKLGEAMHLAKEYFLLNGYTLANYIL